MFSAPPLRGGCAAAPLCSASGMLHSCPAMPDLPAGNPLTGRQTVTRVPKPWGYELIWAHTDQYVGKILHVNAGEALSVQYHNHKDETVHLLNGQMIYWVKLPDSEQLKDMKLKQGESFRVAPGTVHYIQAVTDCDILEASTPHLDDVVRIKDRYGREGTSAP
jgi:mannose-6-phosphate isomerase-like protein (cupin superfamily)